MSDWTTVRIRKTTKEQAEQDKQDEESWDAYIDRCSKETGTDTKTEREFVDLEDLQIDESKLYRRLDDLETEIKHTIERETRR